jgi:hypothetical protein
MAKTINKLSTVAVAAAKEQGLHGDGGGLYLQVSASGAKGWLFRYKANGRSRYMGLGSLSTVTLAQAREIASDCRRLRLRTSTPSRIGTAGARPLAWMRRRL